jgi:GNAT superfamily N-acetyltransferase
MRDSPDELKTYITQMLETKFGAATSSAFSVEVKPETKGDLDLLTIDIAGDPGQYLFTVIPKLSLSANGSLTVHEAWRGRAIGRALIETREATCTHLGIETIIIGENANDLLWFTHGYEPLQDRTPYREIAHKGIIKYREHGEGYSLPLMKRL